MLVSNFPVIQWLSDSKSCHQFQENWSGFPACSYPEMIICIVLLDTIKERCFTFFEFSYRSHITLQVNFLSSWGASVVLPRRPPWVLIHPSPFCDGAYSKFSLYHSSLAFSIPCWNLISCSCFSSRIICLYCSRSDSSCKQRCSNCSRSHSRCSQRLCIVC